MFENQLNFFLLVITLSDSLPIRSNGSHLDKSLGEDRSLRSLKAALSGDPGSHEKYGLLKKDTRVMGVRGE
jgi:hypothetical protein